ncbi:MAG: phosphoribosyltransferase family protein [Prevotella sp.]|nr:phosphoribosyltransferase family protein [Prevotella sp.]
MIWGAILPYGLRNITFFEGIDCIIPVPLSRKRLRKRGYNQSEDLAEGLSSVTHLPILTDVVRRVTFHESQTHLSHFQRQENLKDAFQLRHPEKIVGKHILVVDDVITSGATVCACASVMEKAGEVKISVFALGFTQD